MSGQPVVVGTPQLIFKDVRVMGYWHSRWMVQRSYQEKQQMIDDLVRAVLEHNVKCPPARVFALRDVQAAFHWQSNQGAIRSKLVWDCREHAGI
jgi:NADPH:quinone reductase-like Zn-dependent oxidoreductase